MCKSKRNSVTELLTTLTNFGVERHDTLLIEDSEENGEISVTQCQRLSALLSIYMLWRK